MRNLLRIAALLGLLLAPPSAASAAPCLSQSDIIRATNLEVPRARLFAFGGEAARRFLAAYNVVPPYTDLWGDAIVIIDRGPSAPAVMAILFKAGCATAGGGISRPMFDQIRLLLARSTA